MNLVCGGLFAGVSDVKTAVTVMAALECFEMRSRLPAPAEVAFAWHERPGAFQRLAPPWERIELVSQTGGIQDGARAEIRMAIGPFRRQWIAEHRHYVAGEQFQDVQLRGPFAQFEHTHRIAPDGPDACWLTDHIEYRLPGGWLGRWLAGGFVRRQLERTFRYRHRLTAEDLAAQLSLEERAPMKILITGATGLVGRELTSFLTTGGHEVSRLVRGKPSGTNDIRWDPAAQTIDASRLEGLDGVVHLAGENIAGARWTAAVKERLARSRLDGTRLLCETLAQLQRKPRVLVCASAIGYYGDRGDEVLTESSAAGTGFLPELCQQWEAACEPARQAGIRVVNLRIGVVLTPKGGALAKMLLPFRLGAGGVMGNGRQYWSWIAIDDVIGAIDHCLRNDDLAGPVNATAPQPTTNLEFTKTLGAVLHRPTLFPMPAFAVRAAFGQMGQDLLLASARVEPRRLTETGYRFRCATLRDALQHLLGM